MSSVSNLQRDAEPDALALAIGVAAAIAKYEDMAVGLCPTCRRSLWTDCDWCDGNGEDIGVCPVCEGTGGFMGCRCDRGE